VTVAQETLLAKLGFLFGTNSPHAARTMMLKDLATLFRRLPPTAQREDYSAEIIDRNCFGKRAPDRDGRARGPFRPIVRGGK